MNKKDGAPVTDPHKGGTRPARSDEMNVEVVPMQLNKDSLDAIDKSVMQGLLQAEKDMVTLPGSGGTHSANGKEQGEQAWRRAVATQGM